ncbi:MAG: hypothetical protein ACKO5E_08720 [bacterium]
MTSKIIFSRIAIGLGWLQFALICTAADQIKPFVIRVIDAESHRPVPLVQIATVHQIVRYTDNAGITAWTEPELLGEDVFFQLKSHGYEFAKDGFGFPGKRLKVEPGKTVELSIKRTQIVERLYRITGAGRLAESQLAGQVKVDNPQAMTKARVTGQDSVQMTRYKNGLHWMWGDTSRLAYPLGNFHMPSARTPLPGPQTWDPENTIPLEYFVNKETGLAAETCRMPGDGPTWLSALASVPDKHGKEQLAGWYSKIKPPMDVYRRGNAVWNDEKSIFESVSDYPPDCISPPEGAHDLIVEENGQKWLYFCDPFPFCRVKASFESYCNPDEYEFYTCLKPGSTIDNTSVNRDSKGQLQFTWQKKALHWNEKLQQSLIKKGLVKLEECPIQLKSSSGETITTARGTLAWNEYRQKWVMIFGQIFGKPSLLGEIWFSESDTLTGPWHKSVKLMTHEKYSFYNVAHHPELDSADSRMIYLEGTYTATFSGNESPTPRYDYNQILYKLDLADPRLQLK